MAFQFMRSKVEILVSPDSVPEADALLLPTNDYLWMAAGPALSVKQIAGEEVELEAVRAGPIPLGGIVVTGPGKLPVSAVIHAAVMGQDLQLDDDAAPRAMDKSIREAIGRGWSRILIHSFLNSGRGTARQIVPSVLAGMVEVLLDAEGARTITLLAIDEGEKAILHEAMIRIIQSHG